MSWGFHLILDVSKCNKIKITDPAYLKEWVQDLVKTIDMVAYGEPQIVHFGEGETHLSGWTVMQLIETSNIMAHFCDAEGDAYIDVFSCKPFDPKVVEDHINTWFIPHNIKLVFLTRQA